jgi:PAS domain S-box-containing protein
LFGVLLAGRSRSVIASSSTTLRSEEHDGGRMSAALPLPLPVPLPLVLVFDRDANTRAWYRGAFVSSDYRVAEAADGTQALALLASQVPDLIITELRPYHRDGLTLGVIKRLTTATADIPILMMKLDGDPDAEAAALLVGAATVIEKPPSQVAVLAVARRLILATPPARLTRRRLYRTLADLKEASAQTADAPANGDQATPLLTKVASALSSVLLADDAAKCVAVNAAACHLSGYSSTELLNRSLWDLARPDSQERARMLWARFLVNGECAGEFFTVQKDGAEVTIQLCAVANIAPGLHAVVVGRGPLEV